MLVFHVSHMIRLLLKRITDNKTNSYFDYMVEKYSMKCILLTVANSFMSREYSLAQSRSF